MPRMDSPPPDADADADAANLHHAFGPRRLHLAALDAAVRSKPELACGIVLRDGLPVLHVISTADPTRMGEIGCDPIEADWRYVWLASGEQIGRAAEPERVTDHVASVLTACRERGLQ